MPTELADRLCDLALLWEERRGLSDPVSAEELCCDAPELLVPLRERIAKLERMNALLGPETLDLAVSTAGTGSSLNRPSESKTMVGERLFAQSTYRIVRPHAKGGLGEVLLANDEQLGRPVALKRIRESFGGDPERRQRFLREAEITSRLEHPGIVPVHGVCEDEAGRPCYVMRFIEGETLLAAIQRFHAEDNPTRDLGERRLALRQLLTRFVAACNTVAYAHSRGVIHRDLKPANIMLGPYGETLVVDWGLAKEIGNWSLVIGRWSLANDGQQHSSSDSITNDQRPITNDQSLTQTGAALGTPAFMSPEQAAGRIEELGPASDIYSLGATLFALLTGKAPFEGLELGVLFDRLERGVVVAPRSFNADVSRPLDAICLKAMSREPSQRYATAVELAEDIEHWLADEPVAAYRELLPARASRFARRHRGAVMAASVTAFSLAVASYFIAAAVSERRLTSLTHEILLGLDERDWNDSHLAQMDSLVARLSKQAPDQALLARERIDLRLNDVIHGELQQQRLEPVSVAHLEGLLKHLESRDPQRASLLRIIFQQRLRDWEPVFELKSPFANQAEVFGKAFFPIEAGALLRPATKAEAELSRDAVSVLTKISSPVRAQLRAEFELPEGPLPEFGLLIDARQLLPDPKVGRQKATIYSYAFLVSPPRAKPTENSDDEAGPSQTAALGQRAVEIRILRNGVVQRQEKASLPSGSVTMTVSREGDQLQVQLNELPPLVFLDPFPLRGDKPGSFGVVLPVQVRLAQLTGFRQPLPAGASPLEQADESFAQTRFEEALRHYQAAARAAVGETALEARYKSGLCLLRLSRTENATELLEQVAADATGRWALLASCQLWALHTKARQLEAADAIHDSINTRYRVRDLYATVPTELREEILKSYQSFGVQHFLYNPERIRNLERALAAFKLLGQTPDERIRTSLIRAYCLAGEEDKALNLASESLQLSTTSTGAFAVTHLEDVCWMQRRRGDAAITLKVLDRRLKSAPRITPHDLYNIQILRIEKSRTLIVLEQWDAAEKLLAEMTAESPVNPANSHAMCSANLMLGFLRERRGDSDGAKQAWRQGLLKSPGDAESGRAARVSLSSSGVNVLLAHLIMAANCGELDDALAEQIHKRLTSTLNDNPQTAQFVASLGTPTQEYRKMWLTPRGRDWGRRIAFRDLSFADYVQVPVLLTMHQGLHDLTFAAEPTAEQDELLWTFCRDLHSAYSRGEVGMAEILQLVLTWKGTTNALGWAGVAPKLAKPLRAQAAYFAGVRYQRLKRLQESEHFWKSGLVDAEHGSDIARLLQGEANRAPPP